jgi:hypothetical protein
VTPVSDLIDIPDPFENRLREAIVVPADTDVATLREATKNAAASLGSGDALDLVRCAHGQPLGHEAEARLRARLNAKQPVLSQNGETQMLRTLAAITLVNVLSRPQYAPGLIPALAIRSASHQGWDSVHPDLGAFSGSYLRDRAMLLRAPVSQGEYWQQVKGEEQREPAKELEAMRRATLREAGLQHESNELQWWLLRGARPPGALALAREIAGMITHIPEPPNCPDFVRAKLAHPATAEEAGTLAPPAVPPELSDFCPTLLASGGPDTDPTPTSMEVMALLNEMMLIRALTERPIER